MFNNLTITKAAGPEVHNVAEDGDSCEGLMYRAELTVTMHNGLELQKQAENPTYVPDIWTITTDEATT